MIDPAEIDWLAAQYALGSLPPGERRLVQARIGQDRSLAAAIDAWERLLSPLSLREPGLTPPPLVLEGALASIVQQGVSDRLIQAAASPAPAERSSSVPRRRNAYVALAAVLGVIAIGLGAVLLDQNRRTHDPILGLLAPVELNAEADEPTAALGATFVVVLDARSSLLTVRRSAGKAARADRAYALWLKSDTGSSVDVVLLGRLEKDGSTTLRVDGPAARRLEHGQLFVTLEAEAWTIRPRGPTIASGRLLRSR